MSKTASALAKGLAIIMMLFHHLFYSTETISAHVGAGGFSSSPLSEASLVNVAQSFKICVAVFVFITAYGTFRQLDAKGLISERGARLCERYSIEHVVKLLAGFWCVFVLAQAVALLVGVPSHWAGSVYGGNGVIAGIAYFLIDGLGLSSALGTPSLNATWWYMSLAILLIFLVPVLIKTSRLIGGWALLAMSALVPLLAGWELGRSLWWYLPSACAGIACAQYGTFERLLAMLRSERHAAPKAVVLALLLAVLLVVRQRIGMEFAIDALAAFLVCLLSCVLEKTVARAPLCFLGAHSMNIFLLHTFIYDYFFGSAIYSLVWFPFILLALLAASLLCSVLIEAAKRAVGFSLKAERAATAVSHGLCAVRQKYDDSAEMTAA